MEWDVHILQPTEAVLSLNKSGVNRLNRPVDTGAMIQLIDRERVLPPKVPKESHDYSRGTQH
jgi:hypothetical protein